MNAYVRGFNISPMTTDLEEGVAMTSYRKDRDKWNAEIIHRLEEDPECEGVDIRCIYESGNDIILYNQFDSQHKRNRQQYPKMLRIRTSPKHRCRLMLLMNKDIRVRKLAKHARGSLS